MAGQQKFKRIVIPRISQGVGTTTYTLVDSVNCYSFSAGRGGKSGILYEFPTINSAQQWILLLRTYSKETSIQSYIY